MDLHLTASLLAYFIINLSLSTSNKVVLEIVCSTHSNLVVIINLLTSAAVPSTVDVDRDSCNMYRHWMFDFLQRGHFKMKYLTFRENTTLALFSCLFTINIAMSNLSL